ncbi:MAG TPA: dipeptidase PepV, partial [Bacillota bacterium]|nr:dipeptidase PepV [Bacillota bacterium]
MNLHERVSRMEGEMVQFLQTLVRIPSVKSDEAGAGAPFGKDAARALSEVLSWGENQGFQCKNIDGYAGHIEYGGGDETVGVLVHLDVVPAGDGWNHPP